MDSHRQPKHRPVADNPARNILLLCLGLLLWLAAWPQGAAAVVSDTAPEMIQEVARSWKGDLDGMVARRMIRVLVVPSKTFYFLDGAQQRGITYEMLAEFEKFINARLKKGSPKVNVVIIPVRRDQLFPGLVEGRADIAAANLTITDARRKQADFADPGVTGVSEVVVTGSSAPVVKNLDDLSGREIYVRKSSSYYESLQKVNASFAQAGKKPIKIVPADELLEDEDLLEMVNAGLIPMIVMDNHKAEFWAEIFDQIKVRPDLAVRTGGGISWALRKDTPQLMAEVNAFVKGHKKGTLLGNILFKRYLKDTGYIKNSLAGEDLERFRTTIALFQQYAATYDFDWLMVAAQAYQESGLDQKKRSPVGAVGVMQVLPSTAQDRNVNIPDIHELEANVHAGVKYMRFIMDQYFADADMDAINRNLFAFACYNAGPAKVSSLRRQAAQMGLDPNVWFQNVEVVAAQKIGRETVNYVGNIYKYYVAYRLIVDQMVARREIKQERLNQK